MIRVNINPVIFTLGPFSLRWYPLIIILAVITAIIWSAREARKKNISSDTILTIAFWAIPGGVIGSKLVHVIDYLDFYIENPGQIFSGQGQAIYGAVFGGLFSSWLGCQIHKFPFGKLTDIIAPGLLIAQAIGRIANIINGDAYGKATDLPWAFVYTHPNTFAPLNTPTHPTPVYEILWDLIVLGIVLRLRGKLSPDGSLFVSYLALYSIGRFFISFLRVNKPFIFPWLNEAQVIALAVFSFSAFWLSSKTKLIRPAKTAPPTDVS